MPILLLMRYIPLSVQQIDQLHIWITALAYLAGLILIMLTMPKVSRIRRYAYILAIPVWLGFFLLYAFAALNPSDSVLTPPAIAIRVLLFAVAMEGLLVPSIDRMEMKALGRIVEDES